MRVYRGVARSRKAVRLPHPRHDRLGSVAKRSAKLSDMEFALVALAVAVLVLGVAFGVALLRGRPTTTEDEGRHAIEAVPPDRTATAVVQNPRDQLHVVSVGPAYELLLAETPLMHLDPIRYEELPERTRLSGTYATWIGALLDNPRVLEFIEGQRWVLAKVPDAIRQGGSWMKSGDTLKAVARGPGTTQFGGIADLVGGGAALGTVAALGPAVVGAVAVAFAHHQIEAAVRRVDVRLQEMDRRFRDADMGLITGGRRLVEEMAEWGPPHLWPQQLRFELAVRRAALDPVCFAQRREVERLVADMLKRGEKFVGLDPERRSKLQQETEVLGLATMVKTQLDYTTTMVLLDCEAAPFGLERLALTSQAFAEDMNALGASLQAAIDGRRPKIIAPRSYRRSRKTAPEVEYLLGEIGRVTDSLGDARETTLVLSVGAAGELEAAVPTEDLRTDDESADDGTE